MKIIDVREPSEYAEGHVAGSINIPLGDVLKRVNEIPEDEQVVMYCRSGGRAGVAVQRLRSIGYTNVENGINQEHMESSYTLDI